MANSKISALTSLAQASVVPASDVLPIVNASTTKKVTVDALINAQLAQSATTTGIGVTSPVLRFAVERDSGSGYVASFRSASGNPYITIQTTGGITQIQGINSAFTNVADIGLQPSGGDVKLGGNITQGVAAKGVNFTANTPAAGMTSQLLNWYEEGTWTPTQGAGLVVVGAFSSSGRYTRVGRQVTVSARLVGATSIACTAGGVFTTGLPYAPNSVAAGAATSSNLAGTILYVDTTIYSVSAMAAAGALSMTATYSV